jgi:hypothetical protein
MTTTATVFEVRRSRLVLTIQILFSATLIAITISHVYNLYVSDGLGRDQVITAGFFAVILAFYLIQSLQHFIDRSPRITVGPDGLTLVDALNETIPWRRVWQISRDRNLLGRSTDAVLQAISQYWPPAEPLSSDDESED